MHEVLICAFVLGTGANACVDEIIKTGQGMAVLELLYC